MSLYAAQVDTGIEARAGVARVVIPIENAAFGRTRRDTGYIDRADAACSRDRHDIAGQGGGQ